jgi:hypothetical protein
MSQRIKTRQLAALMGITINALHKRIRYGTIAKGGLECIKDENGFYTWDLEKAQIYVDNMKTAKPKLSDDIRLAASIVRRIKLDKWHYNIDNQTFVNLRPEAQALILDAINGQT